MSLIGNNFVFVHTPRTGGTSLRSQLTGSEYGHYHKRFKDIPKDVIGNRISFSFERDRVSWFVSLYKYVKTYTEHYDNNKTKSLEYYLDYYIDKMKYERFDNNSDYYCKQSEYYEGVNYVLCFEDYSNSIKFINNKLGLSINPLFKTNGSEYEINNINILIKDKIYLYL